MPFIFKGTLCGYICKECVDPLANVLVRLYRHRADQDVPALAAASPKETFVPHDEEAVAGKQSSLLAEGKTDDEGRFSISLPDSYGGDAFEIDVRIESPVHGGREDRPPLQFTITSLQPRWREAGDDRVAAWEYCLPSRHWCQVLAWWGVFAICGRVTVCESGAPVGGVRVTAFDVDWVEDDPLGDDETDGSGKFLIFYPAAAYQRTPISWVQWEWFHGPDLYFRVDHAPSATPLLVEPRSRGRQSDRENVGPCFCVELCLDEPPPPPPEPPPVFQRVGGFNFLVDIDSAAGGTGKTLADNRAFYSTIRLNGVLAKKFGGQPLEYSFLVTEVDASGVAIGATTQVTPAQIARTEIGQLAIFAPTGPGDPNPIKLKTYTVNGTAGPNEVVTTFTADGWIKVPQESDTFAGGFFSPNGNMINLNTRSLASWPPIDMTGKEAGQSAGPPFAENKYFKIEMRIRPQGGAASSGGVLPQLAVENTLYDNISHHPSWNPSTQSNALGVAMIDVQQLMGPGAGCTEITTDLDVLVTAAHPNLGAVTVEMDGPSGTLEFIEPAPTANEVVGTAAIPTSAPPPVWTVASLPPCAYVVRLSVELLLTTGDSVPLPLSDQIAFCKA
jgi:hypothetical protein